MMLEKFIYKIKRNTYVGRIKNNIFSIFHPIISKYKENNIRREAVKLQEHYGDLIRQKKKSGKQVIDFAAFVVFDYTFGIDGAFRLMMQQPEHWNAKIVVIPDVSRGKKHQEDTYKKTKAFFEERYGASYVLDGWNVITDEYYDLSYKFDIAYYANPYDSMVHEKHSIEYATKNNVIPVYVNYGYDVGHYTTLARLKGKELNYVWKCFTDTTYSFEDYKNYQIIKGKNAILLGYAKMDRFADYPNVKKQKKKILLSPHHTVAMKMLPLSNFLTYSDLILELPTLFPNIDFVFRPHPLLFTNLVNNGIWTNEDRDDYLDKLIGLGVEYSTGGDYLSVFAECDAIVNDCGSFTIEWLFTGKPGCFVYNDKLSDDKLTTLMRRAVSSYYVARNREDIVRFIEEVDNDKIEKQVSMADWVKENIAINYPNVSKKLLEELDILK